MLPAYQKRSPNTPTRARRGWLGIAALLAAHAVSTAFAAEAPEADSPANPLEAGRPPIQIFTPRDYRGHPQNWSVVQHPNARIYVANSEAIMEFDGVEWQRLEGFAQPAISMDLSSDERIYVGSIGAIGYLEPTADDELQYHDLTGELPEAMQGFSQVWRTWAQSDGVYFGTNERIIHYDGSDFTAWEPEQTFHLMFAVGDRVFVRERGIGLLELVDGEFQAMPGGERFAESRVDTMIPWQDETLLVAAGLEGFFVFDGEGFEPWSNDAAQRLPEAFVYHAIRLSDGRLAAATVSDGIYLFEPDGRWTGHYTRETGLPTDAVNFLAEDRQQGLWAALDRGIARVDTGNRITRFDDRNGLTGVVSALHRHQGQMYAGTGDGLFRLEHGPQARWLQIEGVRSQTWDMLSRGADLLVANHQGVYSVADDTARLIFEPGGPAFALMASGTITERIYIGLGDGLMAIEENEGQWESVGHAEGISASVRTMTEGPDGHLWLGTNISGPIRLTLDETGFPVVPEIRRFDTSDGLPNTFQVYPVMVEGALRFSTSGGLYALDDNGDSLTLAPEFEQMLAGNDGRTWHPYTDLQGRIWMHRADQNTRTTELGFAVPSANGEYQWHSPPWLRSMDDHFLPTFHADDGGSLWFGGDEGLFRLDPYGRQESGYSFQTRIRDVVDEQGESLIDHGDTGGTLTLPIDKNRVRFEFAAPSYVDLSANEYQVRLQGLESGWSPWFDEPFVAYTNLWEGDYQFEVRARDARGNVGETAAFRFTIQPPVYRTVWAYAVYAVLLALFARALLRWRFRRLEAQKRALEQEVSLRTRQLEEATVTDPLTGLGNRRYLEKFLDKELAVVERRFRDWHEAGAQVAPPAGHVFFLVDLDHFKHINDTHGHSAGDRVLEQVGQLLSNTFRPSDLLVRWGGEEFLVIARNLSLDSAEELAGRVRAAIGAHAFELDDRDPIHLSCSIGFAAYPPLAEAPDAVGWLKVVDLADACLYAAKNSGRDAWVGVVTDAGRLTPDEYEALVREPKEFTAQNRVSVRTSLGEGQHIRW